MLTVVIIAAFLAGIVVTVLMTGALSGSNNDAIETISGNEMQQSAVSSENSEEFEALMSDPVESSVQSYVSDIPEASEYSENRTGHSPFRAGTQWPHQRQRPLFRL